MMDGGKENKETVITELSFLYMYYKNVWLFGTYLLSIISIIRMTYNTLFWFFLRNGKMAYCVKSQQKAVKATFLCMTYSRDREKKSGCEYFVENCIIIMIRNFFFSRHKKYVYYIF